MTQPDPSNEPPSPASTPTPPLDPEPALGLDRAWGELTSAGRAVVVLVSALLVVAAAVGIGLAVASGDGGDDTVVLAETSGRAVTLEVPGEESVPAPETPVEPDVTVDPEVPVEPEPTTETTPLPADEEAPDETEEDAGATAPEAAPSQVFSSGESDDVGAVTIEEPSTLAWTSEGGTFVLQDLNSGSTLVDSPDSSGEISLEPGDYDMLLSADSGWTVEIRPR